LNRMCPRSGKHKGRRELAPHMQGTVGKKGLKQYPPKIAATKKQNGILLKKRTDGPEGERWVKKNHGLPNHGPEIK